jgi:hypothetical protein
MTFGNCVVPSFADVSCFTEVTTEHAIERRDLLEDPGMRVLHGYWTDFYRVGSTRGVFNVDGSARSITTEKFWSAEEV